MDDQAVIRHPVAGVGVAASAGGIPALLDLIRALPPQRAAAFFIVLHGPGWMLESFAGRLQSATPMPVTLAADGTRARAGCVYLAPGERHLVVVAPTPGPASGSASGVESSLRLVDSPAENFLRPAADPLLRSLAALFGRRAFALILSGMGRDGLKGASEIAAAGGIVLVQDPATAEAASMPRAVLDAGIAASALAPEALAAELSRRLRAL